MIHRLKLIFPYCLILIFSVYFIKDMFFWFNGLLGPNDWDQHFFYLESGIKPLVEYFELPLWNPYYMGGMPILSNPQIKLFTPTYLMGILWGSVAGLKLSIIFYYLVGALSSFYLFRQVISLRVSIALFVSCLFLFSGFLPLHLFAGHTTFIGYLLLPLALAFYLKSLRMKGIQEKTNSILYILLSGSTLALVWMEGSIHIILFCISTSGLAVILFAIRDKRFEYINKFIFVWFIFSILCAHRIVPLLEFYINQNIYYVSDTSFHAPHQIWQMFTSVVSDLYIKKWPTQQYFWWEYGNYIGFLPFLLFIASIGFMRKKDWPFIIVLIFLFLLMMGSFWKYSPANLLSSLPFFSHQRCYARWTSLFLFVWILYSGFLFSRADEYIRQKINTIRFYKFSRLFYTIFISGTILFQFYDLRMVNQKPFKNLFHLKVPDVSIYEELQTIKKLPFYGANSAMFPAIKNNLFVADGYEILADRIKVKHQKEIEYRGEYYLKNSKIKVKPVFWSPGKIKFQFRTKAPDILIINQNYYPGWKCKPDCDVKPHHQLISIPLQKGKYAIELVYSPWYKKLLIYFTGLIFLSMTFFLTWFLKKN